MHNIGIGIISILGSIVFFLGYKHFGTKASKFWKKNAPFLITSERYYQISYLIVAVVWLLFGIYLIVQGFLKTPE